jgi:Secretion system C-terminal sorting domain
MLNSSNQYVQISRQNGIIGTIHATGVGTYKIIGYCTGVNRYGETITASNQVSPLYVQDTQAPSIPNSLQVVHSANHPKLTWDIWPVGLDYKGFKIYKKITEEMGWQYLNSTISNVREYVDATETYPIPGGIGSTHPVCYRVTAYDINGNESVPSAFVTTNVSGVRVDKIKMSGSNTQTNVENYSLRQNYPNPFNPSTNIQYELKEPGLVKLEVYNILGNKVKELVNEVKGTGLYNVVFDTANLPSGIYIYKINVNNYSAFQKMSLLK